MSFRYPPTATAPGWRISITQTCCRTLVPKKYRSASYIFLRLIRLQARQSIKRLLSVAERPSSSSSSSNDHVSQRYARSSSPSYQCRPPQRRGTSTWVSLPLHSPSNIVLKQKPKETKPWCTTLPLVRDRERKPPPQPPKKRKRVMPTTPALTFDPMRNHVPSGRQDHPITHSTYSRPSTSESSESSYDEQQTPFPDNVHDAQKRARILSEGPSAERSASFYPGMPSMEVNDMNPAQHDFNDSLESYSSPSPALPDQSPCTESAFQVISHMYPYGGQSYMQQPIVHPDHGYATGPFPDRPAQGYSVQYPDAAYGRPAPHGLPTHPEYPFPSGRRC